MFSGIFGSSEFRVLHLALTDFPMWYVAFGVPFGDEKGAGEHTPDYAKLAKYAACSRCPHVRSAILRSKRARRVPIVRCRIALGSSELLELVKPQSLSPQSPAGFLNLQLPLSLGLKGSTTIGTFTWTTTTSFFA